ncbi:hypothetical protein [Aquimarina sediminis]|uniref:hypothetical protein n=1 Tax=Aquimarina sediminis TaxID=2070536 RepID=UPI000CA03DE7|nr:hypothetical protein [Aquimarina sediminis]
MTKPRKKRGFRPIKVENIEFNWRFQGTIDVRPNCCKNNILTIDFGWYDVWEFVNDKENEPPEFEPKIVTPQFVSNAIKFALINGWDIERSNSKFKIGYKDEDYKVIE